MALTLRPSRYFIIVVGVLHAVAAIATVRAAIPLWATLPLLVAIAFSAWYNIRPHQKPAQLVWHRGDRWQIVRGDQTATDATLAKIDFFSRYLIVLTLKPVDGRNCSFTIASDSLPADTFRLLRVRMRVEGFASLNPEQDVQ